MKKLLTIPFFVLVSFQNKPEEKKISLTISTITTVSKTFQTIYQYIDKSDLPHRDVEELKAMIEKANMAIVQDTTRKQ